jgi:protein TonB
VLTANDNAGPLDFTDTFVVGQATTFSGGATSSRGARSPVPSKSTAAETLGASALGAAPSRDQSRRASVVGGFAWSCPFPPAADSASINLAVVQLRLRVAAQGRLEHVGVMADPGHGFAEAARRCASGKHFLPALDRTGAPVSSELVVRVRFTR